MPVHLGLPIFRVMWVHACKIIHSSPFPGFHDCSVEEGSEPTAGEKREDKRNVSRCVGLVPATGSTKYLELAAWRVLSSSVPTSHAYMKLVLMYRRLIVLCTLRWRGTVPCVRRARSNKL